MVLFGTPETFLIKCQIYFSIQKILVYTKEFLKKQLHENTKIVDLQLLHLSEF